MFPFGCPFCRLRHPLGWRSRKTSPNDRPNPGDQCGLFPCVRSVVARRERKTRARGTRCNRECRWWRAWGDGLVGNRVDKAKIATCARTKDSRNHKAAGPDKRFPDTHVACIASERAHGGYLEACRIGCGGGVLSHDRHGVNSKAVVNLCVERSPRTAPSPAGELREHRRRNRRALFDDTTGRHPIGPSQPAPPTA